MQHRPPGAVEARPGRLRERLARALDLPPDAVLDLPRVTLIGALELAVENHAGLRAFTSERLVLATACGDLVVEGEQLQLRAVRPGEIRVTGRLRGVHLEG